MHLFIEILRNSILITGLVVVMMMMIESLNIESRGLIFKGLKKTRLGQIVIGALLGSIPGCMGGFATVSLYTHKMFSFGALVAMMVASSGDEAFIMLAMIPQEAIVLFVLLFIIAVFAGYLTDKISDRIHSSRCQKAYHSDCRTDNACLDGYVIHDTEVSGEEQSESQHSPERHFSWKRIIMFIGLALFIAALATGILGHDHSVHTDATHHEHLSCHPERSEGSFHINLLNEEWMNILFAGLSIIVLLVLIFASDHFVEEHLWNHIVRKHLPTIFIWTFGVLLVLGISLQHVEINKWISDNTALMILLAALIGVIPESGPHMIFVTLFASGLIPFPVLLANSISQDGHASIPLLAESRKDFAVAKAINCAVAIAAGYISMILM